MAAVAVTGGLMDAFDPFSAAEAASHEAVEAILSEGGQQLYESYIERKSFMHASNVVSEALVAELRMCFVRYDSGPLLRSAALDAAACSPPAPQVLSRAATGEMPGGGGSPDASPREADKSTPSAAPPSESVAESAKAPGEPAIAASVPAAPASPSGVRAARDEIPTAAQAAASGWTLETEPPRCRIDAWARACVPIRKKLVRPKHGVPEKHIGRPTRKVGGALSSSGGSRSPSRGGVPGNAMSSEGAEVRPQASSRPQMIPIVDEREEDEEEAVLRDMKDREARRKRDEEFRLQRKAADEAEQAAKLAQVKDQMKNKPHTYDSSGNIIWVQPPNLSKLPSANPAPTYVFKKETQKIDDDAKKAMAASRHYGALKKHNRNNKPEKEFSDSFRKFASQQPAMMEVMVMAPGVELEERGRHKGSTETERKGNQTMSRRDYEALVERGKQGYPREAEGEGEAEAADAGRGSKAPSRSGSQKDLAAPAVTAPAAGDGSHERQTSAGGRRSPAAPDEAPSAAGSRRGSITPRLTGGVSVGGVPGFKVVRGEDFGKNLVPQAPATPRPTQPVAATARRVQQKREALGFSLSSRERAPTGTGSRFPGCAAPPPLGATMGHGLSARGPGHEEFYYPNAEDAAGLPHDVEPLAQLLPLGGGPAAAADVGVPDGAIVTKDPALTRRFFPK